MLAMRIMYFLIMHLLNVNTVLKALKLIKITFMLKELVEWLKSYSRLNFDLLDRCVQLC